MKFYSPSAQVCPSPNWVALLMSIFVCLVAVRARAQGQGLRIGREVAIPRHVQDGEEYQLTVPQLIAFGEKLFSARIVGDWLNGRALPWGGRGSGFDSRVPDHARRGKRRFDLGRRVRLDGV